jgi:hypothetical protein
MSARLTLSKAPSTKASDTAPNHGVPGLSVSDVGYHFLRSGDRRYPMGYWGDFVLVRSDRPLAELPPFLARPGCSDEDNDCLTLCQSRPGGWQTAQVCHYLPGDDYQWWLSELVAATGSPAMIATVADSGICQVRALAPSGAGWETFLDPRSAALPEFLDYYLADDGEGASETGEDAAQRLLDGVPGTADQIARWAAEAGFRSDTEALRGILVQEAEPFVEDIFFHLIDACGLPDPFPGAH